MELSSSWKWRLEKKKKSKRRGSQDREKWRSGTDCFVVAHVAHFLPLLSTHTKSTSSSSSFSTSQTRTLSYRKRKMRPRVSRKWREGKKEKNERGQFFGLSYNKSHWCLSVDQKSSLERLPSSFQETIQLRMLSNMNWTEGIYTTWNILFIGKDGSISL